MERPGLTLTRGCNTCKEDLIPHHNWKANSVAQSIYWCDSCIKPYMTAKKQESVARLKKNLSDPIHKCNPFVDETAADLNNLPSQSRTVTKTVTVNERVNDQSYFRSIALKLFSRCVVSGFDLVELCEACHIIPVKGYNGPDKPGNCLLMVGGLHKAFDKFYFTILPTGLIVVRRDLRTSSLGAYHCERVTNLRDDHREYLLWHNAKFCNEQVKGGNTCV